MNNTLSQPVKTEKASKREWANPSEYPGDWYEIKAVFGRYLTDAQVLAASGCIGYALRAVLHGESLSYPVKIRRTPYGETIVRYDYDATKSLSDDRDDEGAFELAARYVVDGSPIRATNRAGRDTQGTRLAEGIGQVKVAFFVR